MLSVRPASHLLSLAIAKLLSAAKVTDKTMSNGSSYQKAGGAAYQPISVNGEGPSHWTQTATNGGRGLLVTHSTLVSVTQISMTLEIETPRKRFSLESPLLRRSSGFPVASSLEAANASPPWTKRSSLLA